MSGAVLEFADRVFQFGHPGAHSGSRRHGGLFGIGCKQEHRQDEHQIPEGRDRPGDPRVGAGCRVKPEQRVYPENCFAGFRASGKKRDNGDQDDHAAEITQSPGHVGDPADLFFANQPRHHQIVENNREFRRDRGEDDEDERVDQRRSRHRKPQERQRDDLDDGKESDPGLSRPGLVGNRSEHGRQHGDDDAGDGQRIAPRSPARRPDRRSVAIRNTGRR